MKEPVPTPGYTWMSASAAWAYALELKQHLHWRQKLIHGSIKEKRWQRIGLHITHLVLKALITEDQPEELGWWPLPTIL